MVVRDPSKRRVGGGVPHVSCAPQCAGEENWVDSRTVYIARKEPPPGAEAYIPQRYPDNRIVSSKVSQRPLRGRLP